MKKFVVSFLVTVILFSLTANSIAEAKKYAVVRPSFLSVAKIGELKDIEFSTVGSRDAIQIKVSGLKDYKDAYLENPDRIVIDISNTKASTDTQKKIDVDGNFVKSVRYSQFDENTARVVIDLKEKAGYYVKKYSDKLVLYVARPILDNAVYYTDGEKVNLVLVGIDLYDKDDKSQKLFTEKLESNDKKYTITFPSSLARIDNKIIRIGDGFVNLIRFYSNKETGLTTISLYAKDQYVFETVLDGNNTVISFGRKTSGTGSSGDSGTKNQDTESPGTDNTGTENQDIKNPVENEISVAHSSAENCDRITLKAGSYKGYNIFRLTDSDRIVIDIPNASIGQNTINVNSSRVKAVRYAQFDKNTARVVLDTKGMPQYEVVEKEGELVINVSNPTYKNIQYHNSGDRVYLTLSGAELTKGGSDLQKLYTGKYDSTGRKYTITFKSSLANIGKGVIKINDSYLESIEITGDDTGKNTNVTFNAKDKFVYEVMARTAVNDTAITILKPASKEDKLVVIDAGHGGVEPGASSEGVSEKNLNLDIALRLNSLLKSKGVKTYMLREDDSYVGLYERAYIANSLNATLFLSIHNNAFNKTEHGTETLYHPDSKKGKRFAQLIQNELISTLGTKDRKLKERPGLVVLKATKMPAALAEIAFVDNAEDRKNLLDENFRQKAAEALCKAVIKMLDEV